MTALLMWMVAPLCAVQCPGQRCDFLGRVGKFPLPPPQPHRQQRPHCGEKSSERDTTVHRLPLISLQDSKSICRSTKANKNGFKWNNRLIFNCLVNSIFCPFIASQLWLVTFDQERVTYDCKTCLTISFVEPADTLRWLLCLYRSCSMGPSMSLQGISDGKQHTED